MPGRGGHAVPVLALVLATVVAGCGLGVPSAGTTRTPDSPTPTTSPTSTPTPSPTSTPSRSPTSSATPSPTSSPTRTATPSGTPAPSPSSPPSSNATVGPSSNGSEAVTVRGGNLPYDATRTYDRVQRLLGTDVDPPVVWVIEDARGSGGNDLVTVGPDVDEVVLAHEYVHYVLYERFGPYERGSPDVTWARWASAEGAAQYVEQEYARRYLDERPRVIRLPPDPGLAYEAAMYRFGARYYETRTTDPGEVTDHYPHPPNTSEQVIHGASPAEEPPVPVRVDAVTDDRSPTWAYEGQRRLGEITVFVTLRTRLDDARAARAASGWGNDRLLAFRGENDTAYAWVIRWDDGAEETEFREAFADFRTADVHIAGAPSEPRRTPAVEFTDLAWARSNATFAYRQVGAETGVVLVGPDRFVERARASGSDGNVTVTLER